MNSRTWLWPGSRFFHSGCPQSEGSLGKSTPCVTLAVGFRNTEARMDLYAEPQSACRKAAAFRCAFSYNNPARRFFHAELRTAHESSMPWGETRYGLLPAAQRTAAMDGYIHKP